MVLNILCWLDVDWPSVHQTGSWEQNFLWVFNRTLDFIFTVAFVIGSFSALISKTDWATVVMFIFLVSLGPSFIPVLHDIQLMALSLFHCVTGVLRSSLYVGNYSIGEVFHLHVLSTFFLTWLVEWGEVVVSTCPIARLDGHTLLGT